jgi:hypothetical protein
MAIPSGHGPKKVVYHIDPQEKLIPTDEQWNQKVKKDLQLFHYENEKQKKDKYERNKQIQLEQLKQMQQKKEAERKALQSERDFFYSIGQRATEKFYVNEDRRKE